MAQLTKDPLLAIASGLLWFFIGVFVFVMVVLTIGVGALLTVERAEMLAHLAANNAPGSVYPLLILTLLLVVGLMYLGVRFFLELRGIVRSVDRGDPFEPENARRLWRMGWIAVAGEALAIVISAVGSYVAEFAADAGENVDIDVGFGSGGIFLILVLFILARVFRQGAEMREDLEGTV